MGDNQSRLADMRSRMGDNQSRLADMRSRMGDNQSRLADMRSRMGDNQSRLADMRSRMSDRMSRQSELTMLRGYNMQIRQSDFNSLHRQDYVKEVFHQTKDLFRGGPDLARDSLIEKRTAQLDTKFGNLQRNMPQFQSKIRFGSEIPRIKELGRQSTYVWAPKSAGNARETFQNIARGAGRMFKESSRLTAYAAVGTLQGALGHFEHAREVRDGYLKTTAEAFKISSPSLERGHYSLHVETINGIRSVNGTMKLQDATYRIQTFNGVQSISRINTGTVGRR
ncbi:MAG: hypothetical protein HY301_04070 [Verrucomicrobia bacterium]|nr:hypothetical protein [Verrucomicrobiota bacterium]